MGSERYIILSDTILDKEKIVMVFRDNDVPGKVWVRFASVQDEAFDGDDGRLLWNAFDPSKNWMS